VQIHRQESSTSHKGHLNVSAYAICHKTEVLSIIINQVSRLQNEMKTIEFEASQSQLAIIHKLNHGIREKKLDQAFANDMLEELVKAVGVPVKDNAITNVVEIYEHPRSLFSSFLLSFSLIFLVHKLFEQSLCSTLK